MWYITHLPPEEMKKSWFIDESKDRIEFNGLFLSVHLSIGSEISF